MPELAFIALGSNVDPEMYLPLAVKRLEELGRLIGVSMVYQNPAVGPVQAPDYLNAAALIETELTAEDFRARLREIESDLGRVRTSDKDAPRVIDLDLCLLGSQVVEAPGQVLPDPDMLTRPHLAVTLAELAPDFPHPVTGEPLRAIAGRLRPAGNLQPRPDVARRLPAVDRS